MPFDRAVELARSDSGILLHDFVVDGAVMLFKAFCIVWSPNVTDKVGCTHTLVSLLVNRLQALMALRADDRMSQFSPFDIKYSNIIIFVNLKMN